MNKRTPRPVPSPEFKAFYIKVVPAALHYAVRYLAFSTSQHVAQEVARDCWEADITGAEAADRLERDMPGFLEHEVRRKVVALWRLTRKYRVDAKQPRHPLPTADPGTEVAVDYLARKLSGEQEAEFENRLERDGEFFDRVCPILAAWFGPISPPPRSAGPWAVPGIRPERDRPLPARDVELMWERFCEVVAGVSRL